MLCATGCGRHSVSAKVPGIRVGTVNDLDDRRFDNEVHLC